MFPPLPPSQKHGPRDGKFARRDTATPHGPCLERDQDPAQAAETDRAQANPRYETSEGEILRGGGGAVAAGSFPAATVVVSGIMSDSCFLPERCIGTSIVITLHRKSQAPAVLEKVSVRPRVGSPPACTLRAGAEGGTGSFGVTFRTAGYPILLQLTILGTAVLRERLPQRFGRPASRSQSGPRRMSDNAALRVARGSISTLQRFS